MGLEAGSRSPASRSRWCSSASCTNSRISDLRLAAGVLRWPRAADGVRLMIVPGSQQVKQQAEREGLHEIIRAAGRVARVRLLHVHRDERRPALRPASTRSAPPTATSRDGRARRETFLASPLTAARRRSAAWSPIRGRSPASRSSWPPAEGIDHGRAFRSFASRSSSRCGPRTSTPTRSFPPATPQGDGQGSLAEALFRDWRFEEDGTPKEPPFVLDRPGMSAAGSCSWATTSAPGPRASTPRGRSARGGSRRS